MSEPTDAVLLILQRIQNDMVDMRREINDLRRDMNERFTSVDERLEKVQNYMAYSMGIISQIKVDNDIHDLALSELKRKVETLEDK